MTTNAMVKLDISLNTDINGGGNSLLNSFALKTKAVALSGAIAIATIGCGSSSSGVVDSGGGSGGSPDADPTKMCGATQTYLEVTNTTTGETWLDRNLGASQVATSSTDHLAYGALFQWGRKIDGHECVTWTNATTGTTTNGTTTTKADDPAHSDFITTADLDWRVNSDDTLWTGTAGANNPCPTGFRLPTETEVQAEVDSWPTQDAAGAFGSVLKLPVPGYRINSDGLTDQAGILGYYWSSTVDSGEGRMLLFSSSSAGIGPVSKAHGMSVRCIRD